MASTSSAPLSAPLTLAFDYTRSLGPVLGAFMAGLRRKQILGVRAGTGPGARVLVPPAEYDPVTAQKLDKLVPVADTGVVTTWSWMPEPMPDQPLDRPFAWALIRLDGADSALLHAVDADRPAMRTGMRVRARWAPERVGGIRDITCFEPAGDETSAPAADPPGREDPSGREDSSGPETDFAADTVDQIVTPIRLEFQHSASPEESRFLRAIAQGRLIGQRCPVCHLVYVPPRSACPVDGVPTVEEIELPDRGTVTTFCVVNVPFLGQRIEPPYTAAHVLLDGADIAVQHLILGVPATEVRIGMRVRAVWRPRAQWGYTLENISHFEPLDAADDQPEGARA